MIFSLIKEVEIQSKIINDLFSVVSGDMQLISKWTLLKHNVQIFTKRFIENAVYRSYFEILVVKKITRY